MHLECKIDASFSAISLICLVVFKINDGTISFDFSGNGCKQSYCSRKILKGYNEIWLEISKQKTLKGCGITEYLSWWHTLLQS